MARSRVRTVRTRPPRRGSPGGADAPRPREPDLAERRAMLEALEAELAAHRRPPVDPRALVERVGALLPELPGLPAPPHRTVGPAR